MSCETGNNGETDIRRDNKQTASWTTSKHNASSTYCWQNHTNHWV